MDDGDDAAAVELLYDELGVLLAGGLSFDDVRFPYLFFKYRAQLLRASLSPSFPLRSGETSRDFNAWVERLRDNSDPDDIDDVPYLEAKYADGDVVVGDRGSSGSSSSPPKLCDDRLLASRFLRSFNAM